MTLLLSVGHSWAEIQDYTLAQFTVFCRAAVRHHAMRQAELVSAVTIGAQGTEKSIKEAIGKLAKQAKG